MPMTTGGGVSGANYYSQIANYAGGLGTVSLEYFTVSLWHRWITAPVAGSTYAEIFYIRGRSGASIAYIRLDGGGGGWGTRLKSVGLQTWNGGYGAAVNTGTDDIVEGQWYHYAIVGDGANGTKAYQDGVEVLSHSTSLIGIGDIALIYNTGGGSSQSAEGQIAHAKLWDAALTQADIAREMATGAPFRFSNIKCWRPHLDDTSDQLGFLDTNTGTYENGTFGGSVPVAQRSQQPIIVEPAAATDVDVTPGTGSLTTTLFAPTVVATANVTVTPATAALVTALFAPAVVATANVNVTPATVALATTLYAPTASSGSVSVTPSTATLVTALFAPSVVTGPNVVPRNAALSTTRYAPTATTGKWLYPASVALPTTGYVPTVSATTNIVMVRPISGSLATAAFAPTVVTNTPQAIITSGTWSSEVTFARGDEYIVTLEGPAANAPAFRVGLTFRSPST
jgi:hypothetical protein